MKQKILFCSLFLLVFCLLSAFYTKPTQAKEVFDLPQQAGLYDVPGHPKLKLKVIVHPAKPISFVKPQPIPTTPPQPICDLEDNNTSVQSVELAGWHLKAGTITYHLNYNSAPLSVGSINFSNIAQNSFNTWITTEVRNGISFQEGLATKISRATFDSQNIITWGRTNPSALAVAYTWYDKTTNEVVEVDTVLNNKFSWAWSNSNTCAVAGYYDAQNILTHELGHWMGLSDAYEPAYANHTMYGYGSKNEVQKNTLTEGDISSVNMVY